MSSSEGVVLARTVWCGSVRASGIATLIGELVSHPIMLASFKNRDGIEMLMIGHPHRCSCRSELWDCCDGIERDFSHPEKNLDARAGHFQSMFRMIQSERPN